VLCLRHPLPWLAALLACALLTAATVPLHADARGKHRRSARDIDGDGILNKRDRDVDGDHVSNRRDKDIDGDHRRNSRDREMDGDGVRNSRDKDIDGDRLRNCPRDPDMDADRKRNGRDRDMDGDGRPNGRDPDVDADGIPNRRDRDIDCDRKGVRADNDLDGDGLLNYEDPDSDASGSRQTGEIPRGVHLPRSFFGLVADHVAASSGAARAAMLGELRGTGVGTIRQKFDWSQIETSPGVYDFRFYDQYVADVTSRGFSILPVLFEPPGFRSSRPGHGGARGTYPPSSNAEFGRFAAALVHRYGPTGSFWAAHPGLPRRPLRAWQIWNEPHIRAYWPTGQDPGEYVAMLRAVGRAIKVADPGAQVVAAGLSETNIGIPVDRYLKGMYAAGGRGSFGAVAVHPYASAADLTFDIMARVRRVMNRAGDRRTGIWVTELGWATWGNVKNPFNLGPRGQAELVKRVWATLVTERARLGLRGLIYYNWRDIPPHAPSFQDYFGLHVGLLARNGSAKPARASFARTVRAMSAG
jgi:polysaccharide biosynthesis protein PslG